MIGNAQWMRVRYETKTKNELEVGGYINPYIYMIVFKKTKSTTLPELTLTSIKNEWIRLNR
jgi:hypothetical protein